MRGRVKPPSVSKSVVLTYLGVPTTTVSHLRCAVLLCVDHGSWRGRVDLRPSHRPTDRPLRMPLLCPEWAPTDRPAARSAEPGSRLSRDLIKSPPAGLDPRANQPELRASRKELFYLPLPERSDVGEASLGATGTLWSRESSNGSGDRQRLASGRRRAAPSRRQGCT